MGATSLPGTETAHAFIMNPRVRGGRLTDITPLEGRSSRAVAVNGSGVSQGFDGVDLFAAEEARWGEDAQVGDPLAQPEGRAGVVVEIGGGNAQVLVGPVEAPGGAHTAGVESSLAADGAAQCEGEGVVLQGQRGQLCLLTLGEGGEGVELFVQPAGEGVGVGR